jgi:hypothetical protein
MRTTINTDQDVLIAIKELAQREGSTVGVVLSRLARAVLAEGNANASSNTLNVSESAAVYGFRPFPKNGSVVTNDSINQLKNREDV